MTTETIDIKALNKLASTCGTRFIRDKRGQVSTKHPLVWKNALWLSVMLGKIGVIANEHRSSDKERYYIVLEGL